jgi:hypothetical protein
VDTHWLAVVVTVVAVGVLSAATILLIRGREADPA